MNSKIINSCNDLDSLFEEWKKAHKEEPDESCRLTMPRKNSTSILSNSEIDAFKESFCRDGYIGEEGQVELVFVLKESNVSNEHNLKPEIDDTFWFRDIKGKVERTKGEERYLKRLEMISKAYNRPLESCAYMNLQKRGGYGKTDADALNEYTKRYKNYINKELEILNPERIIICLGTFDTLVNLVFKDKKKDVCTTEVEVELNGSLKKIKFRSAKIELFQRNGKSRMVTCINMYHPAYWCNDEYYKALFTVFYERLKKTKN